jgi:hypothetical protein
MIELLAQSRVESAYFVVLSTPARDFPTLAAND